MKSLIVAAIAASTAAQVSFEVNLNATATPMTFPMLECVGSSHGATTLRADWREQLATARKHLGLKRVRFHGILDDDMSTYLNGGANMANVFSTYDYLQSIEMSPIIELSFMPQALASNASLTTFHYQGGISPPANWTQWHEFIADFAGLLVDRYGIDTMSTWRFEVWNEPNCGFYAVTNGCGEDAGDKDAYFQLYNVTAHAIKSVDERLQVGGPATAQMSWITPFLEFTTTNKIPVDFISSHLYPTDPEVAVGVRDGFYDYVQQHAEIAQQYGLPMVMTEFNTGLGINVADEAYSAAFMLHALTAVQEMPNLEVMSFWTFTDADFEEGGLDSTPWNEKFGMMNIFGVPKPVFHAFEWINDIAQHAPQALPVKVVSNVNNYPISYGKAGATAGNVDVIVPSPLGTASRLAAAGSQVVKAYVTNWAAWPTNATLETVTIYFDIPVHAAVPSSASVTLIDPTHANPKAQWIKDGSPMYPSQQEIARQLTASKLTSSAVPLTKSGRGRYGVTLADMQPNSVAMVQFTVTHV